MLRRQDEANSRSQDSRSKGREGRKGGKRGVAGEKGGRKAGAASQSGNWRKSNIRRRSLGNFAFQGRAIQSVCLLTKTPSGKSYMAFKCFRVQFDFDCMFVL